jgi:hypothetical protein
MKKVRVRNNRLEQTKSVNKQERGGKEVILLIYIYSTYWEKLVVI